MAEFETRVLTRKDFLPEVLSVLQIPSDTNRKKEFITRILRQIEVEIVQHSGHFKPVRIQTLPQKTVLAESFNVAHDRDFYSLGIEFKDSLGTGVGAFRFKIGGNTLTISKEIKNEFSAAGASTKINPQYMSVGFFLAFVALLPFAGFLIALVVCVVGYYAWKNLAPLTEQQESAAKDSVNVVLLKAFQEIEFSSNLEAKTDVKDSPGREIIE